MKRGGATTIRGYSYPGFSILAVLFWQPPVPSDQRSRVYCGCQIFARWSLRPAQAELAASLNRPGLISL